MTAVQICCSSAGNKSSTVGSMRKDKLSVDYCKLQNFLAGEPEFGLLHGLPDFQRFKAAAQQGNLVPVYERIFSDALTPVLAYRCLVKEGNNVAPSFLLESVHSGDQQASICLV